MRWMLFCNQLLEEMLEVRQHALLDELVLRLPARLAG
jgi:hypothetical protein